MSQIVRQHLARVEGATIRRLQMRDLPRWLENETKILGRPWSFIDHEYQERILSDESQETVIRKCSQVGISEMSIRMALGLAALMPAYSVLYTFPTASFAQTYVKTRVDPVIVGSDYLKAAVSQNVDSAEVKQVGPHGWVYFKGAQAGNAAISVAGDHLIHDELDFSDMTIIGQYQSRLTHSPYKRKTKLSTPTLPNGPIDKAFQRSRRHWLFVRCHCCGHRFVPDYYEHVRIPGYSDDLRKITKDNLHLLQYRDAQLHCPRCHKIPILLPDYREWVCENPSENYLAVGYQVQPFDAPNLISIPFLVESSTQYDRRVDFDNFNLGKPAEDKDNGISEDDIERCGVQLAQSPFSTHVMGADMGLICRIMVGNVTSDGRPLVVHSEEVPIQNFRKRYAELATEYRITTKVLDSQPYVETVMSLQETDANLYGAFFVKKEKLELYDTATREENIEEGKTALRQVSINRNKALDMVMDEIRADGEPAILIRRQDATWRAIKAQCTDMKRTKKLSDDNEFVYVWVKSDDKNDHFHFALLYFWIACKLRATAVGLGGVSMLGVSSFRIKPDEHAKTIYGGIRAVGSR